ncbi:RagB/SusD family nutrient uptake outer membrane protein [Negadavirga shengliensis]|uniref:RagB/SusD family nutrient uptake outer membrane protein n=1 Tax=Negadavirga shengliensis TaxID=1389218 RepID=A0ABV9T739_9BACT
MKKNLNPIYIIAFVAAMMAGCADDVLDVKNLSVYNPDDVWNDPTLSNAYLVDLYASTFTGWPVNNGDNADESVGIIGQGLVQTTNNSFKHWPYTNIRRINVLLNDIDEGTLPEATKTAIKAQAHFMRAFHYFKAVVHHGGVPIIKVPQLLTDDLMVPRSSTLACFEFILEDLEQALSGLPDKFVGGDFGRVDKGAAMAFKGRVLLYMASPQFNPSNPYDNSYWQSSYQANLEARNFLESQGYGLMENYSDIWRESANKEVVLATVYRNPVRVNGRQEHCVRPISQSRDCTGSDQPIWKLVETFPMKDGHMPGESPNYTYDLQRFWENRDPRFYDVIVYNGALYELGGQAGRRQYTDTQVGGIADGFGANATFNRSGFYTKKGIQEELPIEQAQLNDVDWVEIRFAEVLFNLAESANEIGNNGEAFEILKLIRERAGIEAGADSNYGLKAGMTRDELREAIYTEKFIEFAFEGKRFWDLRRARKLHTEIHGARKYGLLAKLKDGLDPLSGGFMPEDFDYEITELFNTGQREMFTPEEYYFFPIHRDEIEKNPNLEQNIGWDEGGFNPVID